MTRTGYQNTVRFPWPKVGQEFNDYTEQKLLERLGGDGAMLAKIGRSRRRLTRRRLKVAQMRGRLVTVDYMAALDVHQGRFGGGSTSAI